MNPAQIIAQFDRICEAPDAVARFRRFTLDLAVRGKLVEQDENDEPVTELLDRVAIERSGGPSRRTAIRELPLETVTYDVVPCSLPQSWRWVRFDQIASIDSNLVKPEDFPDLPLIAPDNIEGRTGRLLDYQTVRDSKVFSAKHRFFSGHILYSKIRPNLAKAALVEFEGLCSADMYPISAFSAPGKLGKGGRESRNLSMEPCG